MNHYEIYLDTLRRDLIEPLSEHIVFDKGLTWKEQEELENFHGIRFPKPLKDFYACAFPVRERNPVVYPWNPTPDAFGPFPDWRDCSEKNVKHLREILDAPVKNLLHDLKRDGLICDVWYGLTAEEVGEIAPKLIPVYGHRYLPMNSHVSPVFSAVGRDVVYFAGNLFEYFRREFLEPITEKSPVSRMPYVPVWGDIPRTMGQCTGFSDNIFPSVEKFTELFTKNPLLLNESAFRFVSDPISPRQPGYITERMIGWCEGEKHPYWIGGCDNDREAQFDTAEELLHAPVFSGRSMADRWHEILWLSLMSIDPSEWTEHFLK